MSYLYNRKAQTTASEIIILLFIVVGAIVGMSVYFQRGIQARLRDSNVFIINMVSDARGNRIPGQYEPYYGDTSSEVSRFEKTEDKLIAAKGSGISRKYLNAITGISTNSDQAPPREAY